MATKSFPVFDCDSHIVEPPAIWDEYVPAGVRAWVKSQFHSHPDTDTLLINGRAVPASRERANAAEVGWPRWNKKDVGRLTPGTEEWKARFGRLKGSRDPGARLSDMDALGTDQVMLFPTWFVRLALVRDAEAARVLATAYNDWVDDYAAADRRRLFPCAVLPIQSVEHSIAELRRVAKKGFRAAAVRPCFWNGRYPTLPEFDPLWREFEELGVVLAMHTFPSRETLYRRCFIAFESDEAPVYRMWDLYENVGIWSSDYPHHDAEDAWEALELMAKFGVPEPVQKKLLGENARRLYGIEPVLVVKERIDDFRPEILAW